MIRVLALALLGLALAAPAASAHARLEGTSPARGATVADAPRQVVFRFDEPVEATFGAVRVFDAHGTRVDDGRILRPGGRQEQASAALRSGLPHGTYTATYRVISADGHPVSGGFTFSIGHPGAAPAKDVADLIAGDETGPVTEIAFGAAKALGYLAIALALGGLGFLAFVWRPALAAVAGGDEPWVRGAAAFAMRARALLAAAVGLGLLTSVAGLVLQGATAAAVSGWSALDPTVVREVATTHAGTGWMVRLVDWALLAVVLRLLAARGAPVLRPVPLGAAGHVLERPPSRPWLALLAVPALVLALTPALAGHASTQDPVWALFALDVAHVLAMSAWLGGLVVLVACVPAATRMLAPADRSRLLAAALARFSPRALAAVCVLLASGVTQALLEVRSLDAFTASAYGRAVLIKAALLVALIGLGAVNRRRVLPALARLAAGDLPPGGHGRLLRRTLRAEVVLVLVVLGVTGALTGYPPPAGSAGGPQTAAARMGPLDLQLTVDPAQVGRNELHLYLFRTRDGAPFAETKELTVRLRQADKGIGPIDARMRSAGPGHFLAEALTLSPGGAWEVEVTDRVSEFDQYTTTTTVNIR